MESLLWMIDLVAVVYLCFWALREDRKESGEAGRIKGGVRPQKD